MGVIELYNIQLREISRKNADKIILKFPFDDMKWILNDLWDYNARMWLDNQNNLDTIGSDSVRDYGFTTNQLRWIDSIFDRLNDEKYNQLLEQHKSLQEAYIKLGGGGVVDGNVVDAISDESFLTYRDIRKYIDMETKLIGLRASKPSGWKFIGYMYDSQGKPKQFLVREGD